MEDSGRFDKESLRKTYEASRPRYQRLAKNLKQALEIFLKEEQIDVLDIYYRVKEFGSFWDKIERKNYTDPLNETDDICGLRIVCFYTSDLLRIAQVIEKEFDIVEMTNKADKLGLDQFGYRSLQGVITVKRDWLNAPNYRDLGGLKAEVQIRTVLMHAWAEIEHKLAYKKKEHIPGELRRKFSLLSAQLEGADERFDGLRKDKEKYIENIVSEEVKKTGRFDVTQPVNIDSLLAFLDFYFPDRYRSDNHTIELLDEIMKIRISMKDLVESYELLSDVLPQIEAEICTEVYGVSCKSKVWAQWHILTTILDLTNDDYWKSHQRFLSGKNLEIIKRWREKLTESEGDR